MEELYKITVLSRHMHNPYVHDVSIDKEGDVSIDTTIG